MNYITNFYKKPGKNSMTNYHKILTNGLIINNHCSLHHGLKVTFENYLCEKNRGREEDLDECCWTG